jgi:hypothetical protein
MTRPRLIALIVASLAGVYALAGSLMVSGGKVLVGADGKALTVAAATTTTTTTTTTTIPAPENLITNGTFTTPDAWTIINEGTVQIVTGAAGYAEGIGNILLGESRLLQTAHISNGWTYAVVLTAFGSLGQIHRIGVNVGGVMDDPAQYECTPGGIYSQNVVSAGNDNFWLLWLTTPGDGEYAGSVSNIQLYTVSAP